MSRTWISPAAGTWYQDSRMALEYDLSLLCREITVIRKRTVCAAVVPHAMYRFSGRTAAGVYLRIDARNYRRAVILTPSHYEDLHNRLSVPEAAHIVTPLGEIAVDTEWAERLRALPFVTSLPAAHAREHGDQIQLPLIQYCLSKKLPVVCAVCGRIDADRLLEMADAVRALLDAKTLVVVSSDFTHFGANFGDLPSLAREGEHPQGDALSTFELFAAGDLQGFLKHLRLAGHTMCVRDPLPLLMAMMPEGAKVSRVGGVVRDGASYAGALVEGSWTTPVTVMRDTEQMREPLTEAEGMRLLDLGISAVRRAFRTQVFHPIWSLTPAGLPPRLRTVRGGFVTLYREGVRQGCMGEVVPHRPIWQVAVDQTLKAAFHDSRVPAVEERAWGGYEVEIEVLTAPRLVGDWRSIKLGEQGILLRKGSQSALFLPRVPVEAGWLLEETLEALSKRAGLPPGAWREGASLMVFEAQAFRRAVGAGGGKGGATGRPAQNADSPPARDPDGRPAQNADREPRTGR
ncbi:MAG: AmmeMemoRadiSam system protein B [Kiritimatiellae bacterium]|nr:AmmeMemoRadiSam system protein B [Kiritimatiellia bacterium]